MKHTGMVLFFLLIPLTPFDGYCGENDSTHPIVNSFRCGTCEYLRTQYERIRNKQKPIYDPKFVPPDYWDIRDSNHPLDAYGWPRYRYKVLSNRTDTNGNGLRECRYKIDLSRMISEGKYTQEEINSFYDEIRYGINLS